MTPEEFDVALTALGVTSDAAAARLLGCTPRAIRHWRQGARRIPGPVVVLLAVLRSI